MQYGEILTKSLAITWRHKYLWLLALFAGEGAAGSLFTGSGGSTTRGNTTSTQTPAYDWNVFTTWVSAHVLLLVSAVVFLAAISVILFVISAVANGALVRASAEFDAERPFTRGQAWNAGLATFWPVLKVKLFAVLVALISFVVIGGLLAGAALLAVNGVTIGAVILGIVAVLLILPAIPFSIIFGVVILLAVRGVALEGMGASAAVIAGFRTVQRRLGRIALLWLIDVVVSIGIGVATAIAAVALAFITAGVIVAAYLAGGTVVAIVVGALLGVIWLGLALTASGAIAAFTSTYWTLGYRRLDLEPTPMALAAPPAAA